MYYYIILLLYYNTFGVLLWMSFSVYKPSNFPWDFPLHPIAVAMFHYQRENEAFGQETPHPAFPWPFASAELQTCDIPWILVHD